MASGSWKPFRLAAYKGKKGFRLVSGLLVPIFVLPWFWRERKSFDLFAVVPGSCA